MIGSTWHCKTRLSLDRNFLKCLRPSREAQHQGGVRVTGLDKPHVFEPLDPILTTRLFYELKMALYSNTTLQGALMGLIPYFIIKSAAGDLAARVLQRLNRHIRASEKECSQHIVKWGPSC